MYSTSVGQPHRLSQQTVYFAYGSNLCLEQMADRCPESRYLGRGALKDYRWQINEKGVANIVPSSNSYVEGLCYILSRKDEERLDRKEGVPTAYTKQWLEGSVYTSRSTIAGRRVKEVVETLYPLIEEAYDLSERNWTEDLLQENLSLDDISLPYIPLMSEFDKIQLLVYISNHYTQDGQPRVGYGTRIRLGIRDGLALGLNTKYVNKYIPPELTPLLASLLEELARRRQKRNGNIKHPVMLSSRGIHKESSKKPRSSNVSRGDRATSADWESSEEERKIDDDLYSSTSLDNNTSEPEAPEEIVAVAADTDRQENGARGERDANTVSRPATEEGDPLKLPKDHDAKPTGRSQHESSTLSDETACTTNVETKGNTTSENGDDCVRCGLR